MSWTEFLKILILLYAVYYTFFIALDMLRARTGTQNKEQSLVLSFPQEAPTIVSVSEPQEAGKKVEGSPAPPPLPAERDWQQDIPEQDPEELYDEEEDKSGGEYMDSENTNEKSAEQAGIDRENIDPSDKQQENKNQEHRSEVLSAPGPAQISSQLGSGITSYSGAIELTDLFHQVLDGGMELIDRLYIKSALE